MTRETATDVRFLQGNEVRALLRLHGSAVRGGAPARPRTGAQPPALQAVELSRSLMRESVGVFQRGAKRNRRPGSYL